MKPETNDTADGTDTNRPSAGAYGHTHTLETMTLDGGVVSVETSAPRADGRFVVHHDGSISAAPWVADRHGNAWVDAAIAYLYRADIVEAVYGRDGFSDISGGTA
jgi:hypothetical protein